MAKVEVRLLVESWFSMPLFPLHKRTLMTTVITLCAMMGTQEVEASCGDWLAHPKNDSSPTEVNASQADSNKAGPVTPCHGPECRNTPRNPGAPSPLSEWSSHRNDGTVVQHGCDRSRAFLSGILMEANATAFQGFPLGIDHPPQA